MLLFHLLSSCFSVAARWSSGGVLWAGADRGRQGAGGAAGRPDPGGRSWDRCGLPGGGGPLRVSHVTQEDESIGSEV